MADHRNVDATISPAVTEPRQSPMARRAALAIVQLDVADPLDEDLLTKLHEATLNPVPDVCRQVIVDAVEAGACPEELADFYIPTLARRLGDLWCVDEISFASVTIGVSRLQAMLRALGPNWVSDTASSPDAPSLLLIVPKDVYHTLGAIVLSGQLRRKGYSVKLILGGKLGDIADRIQRTTYAAVFISSSRGETLDSLRQIVDVVKTSAPITPSIVIGGSILEVEAIDKVTALTGADFATKNPDEALRLCGLRHTIANDTRVKIRT